MAVVVALQPEHGFKHAVGPSRAADSVLAAGSVPVAMQCSSGSMVEVVALNQPFHGAGCCNESTASDKDSPNLVYLQPVDQIAKSVRTDANCIAQ